MQTLASQWLRSTKAKRMFSLCRWLHLYVSATLFCLILFFSLTGLTLNHPAWQSESHTQTLQLNLPEHIADQIKQQSANLLPLTQFLAANIGLQTPRRVELFMEDSEVTVDYAIPAGYAFVTVDLALNTIEVEYKKGGVISILNDLHKGRHSAVIWSWLIDITAILSILFTLTGGILLLQNPKHRRRAALALLFGIATPAIVYWVTVPQLTL